MLSFNLYAPSEVEEEIEAIASEQLAGLDQDAAGGVFAESDEEDASPVAEEEESDVRKEVAKRLKKLAEDDDDEDEN